MDGFKHQLDQSSKLARHHVQCSADSLIGIADWPVFEADVAIVSGVRNCLEDLRVVKFAMINSFRPGFPAA